MALYTGPWRTSICLGVTAMLGGIFIGLGFLPQSSGGLRLGLMSAGVLWSVLFTVALGREIAQHWRDRNDED